LLLAVSSLILPGSHPAWAQSQIAVVAPPPTAAKEFSATRIAARAGVEVDGHLDEPAWAGAAWRRDFLQKEPVEGGEPSGRTEVAFLYDDQALYVGARMYSADPGRIPTAVTRRDQFSNAEHLVIALDTYLDRRTAYSFIISSGGVRGDYYHPSDSEGSRDYTWDPVWQARVTVDSLGWTAEARIPFSQLRFTAAGSQTWGVQVNRWMPHADEDVYWIVIPHSETGWASRFGTLKGIEGVRPTRRLELQPYVAGNATFEAAPPGDPFNDGSDIEARAGADLKMGLGPNLTLDATVNPDFGQVEADPAEVNLSAFETFFDERRPFFTEGAQLLRGGGSGFFYSRRIGQSPRGPASGDFVDRPRNATILGAAKVSGRLRSGTSIGLLTAFTGQEKARTYDVASGRFAETPIEPFTAYGVARVQQEFGPDASVAGVSLTMVQRDLGDSTLKSLLPGTAFTGGADVNLRFRGGAYEVRGSVGFSHLRGDEQAMLRVQQHPAHFFQRPDATEFRLDSTRSSFTGAAGSISASKNSGKHWLWSAGASFESPNFELNDIGRLGSANDIETYAQLRWRETAPGRLFHRRSSNLYVGRGWNFGGVNTYTSASLGNSFTFKNFWNLFLGGFAQPRAQSDDLTRGGPLMGRPGGWGGDIELNGNEGKPVNWNVSLGYFNDEAGGWNRELDLHLSARPAPAWRLSVGPSWERRVSSRQYVTTLSGGGPATYGGRYVFAYVDRNTLSASIRVNYAFNPDLSLELWGEPFVASGRYSRFGELPAARSYSLRRYGTDGTTITRLPDGSRDVTDGAQTFNIPDRDFNLLSFRSNLVLRWEWRPGSTLFLVWQQDRFGAAAGRSARVGSLFDSFSADGAQFLAVKMTYWFAAR
jgi:hypothetical protein